MDLGLRCPCPPRNLPHPAIPAEHHSPHPSSITSSSSLSSSIITHCQTLYSCSLVPMTILCINPSGQYSPLPCLSCVHPVLQDSTWVNWIWQVWSIFSCDQSSIDHAHSMKLLLFNIEENVYSISSKGKKNRKGSSETYVQFNQCLSDSQQNTSHHMFLTYNTCIAK